MLILLHAAGFVVLPAIADFCVPYLVVLPSHLIFIFVLVLLSGRYGRTCLFAALLKADVVAGIRFVLCLLVHTCFMRSCVHAFLHSTGLNMLPKSLAFSLLAGLPPEFGLYSAFVRFVLFRMCSLQFRWP